MEAVAAWHGQPGHDRALAPRPARTPTSDAPFRAPNLGPPHPGSREFRQRHAGAPHAACRLPPLPTRPCRYHRPSRSSAARAMPGRRGRVHRPRPWWLIATPWVGTLTHLAGLKSAPQIALGGLAACAGRASPSPWSSPAAVPSPKTPPSKSLVEYEPLSAAVDMETALDSCLAPVIHPELGDNLAWERRVVRRPRRCRPRRRRRRHRGHLSLRPPHRRARWRPGPSSPTGTRARPAPDRSTRAPRRRT